METIKTISNLILKLIMALALVVIAFGVIFQDLVSEIYQQHQSTRTYLLNQNGPQVHDWKTVDHYDPSTGKTTYRAFTDAYMSHRERGNMGVSCKPDGTLWLNAHNDLKKYRRRHDMRYRFRYNHEEVSEFRNVKAGYLGLRVQVTEEAVRRMMSATEFGVQYTVNRHGSIVKVYRTDEELNSATEALEYVLHKCGLMGDTITGPM